MYSFLALLFDVVSAVIVLIPVFLLLHLFYIKDLKKSALYFVFGVYLAGAFSAVGLPDVKNLVIDFGVNVIPFIDMVSDFKNAVLNVILFVPLGFLLPFIWEKFREFKYTLMFGFGMTAFIEILQIFTFRLTDINDLITNTLGTIAGYFIVHMIIEKTNKFLPVGKTKDVFIISGIVFCIMFTAVPFISSVFWNFV